MNIQQLNYVISVYNYKNFEAAAEKCFITQSTLSTMIKKFEDEIGITIFNRKTKPVTITKEGEILINQIKIITKDLEELNYISQELKNEINGNLSIGIIPTIAPYILHLFLPKFAMKFPKLKISIHELTTEEIIRLLKKRNLDIGILALPLNDNELVETPIYNEPFLGIDCFSITPPKTIDIENFNYSNFWLLEEGNCFRNQVKAICEINNSKINDLNFEYKAGSIESLIRFTKATNGITIIPYLASKLLTKTDKKMIINFNEPSPVRTVGIVTHENFVKQKITIELKSIIENMISKELPTSEKISKVIDPI